jgi:hypothetical protein
MQRPYKRKRNLFKLNKLTKEATKIISDLGHISKRFVRDYENGTAIYQCARCGMTCFITCNPVKIHGKAAMTLCNN